MAEQGTQGPLPSDADADPARRSKAGVLFLAGDVMTGRGIDQVLPHPGDPWIQEPYVHSAHEYVALAEDANGPIPASVSFSYVWGDALAELRRRQPDARIVNLETAVTQARTPVPKGINYRMHPSNVFALTAAGIDCCVLANNHVLDWGEAGLRETLRTLDSAGIAQAGAGADSREAAAPAVLPSASGGRILVFGLGLPTSGIPSSWAAEGTSAGVNLLPDLSPDTVGRIAAEIEAVRRAGDLVVVSVHWGPNWGYAISDDEVGFAHGLVEKAGADVIHGHSSHHPKAVEIHRGKLILYGCGDFLNDYEGISGYESFRDDLVLGYFPTFDPAGDLEGLEIAPFQIRNFRLNRPSPRDVEWLWNRFNELGRRFGTHARLQPDGIIVLDRR